MVARKKAKRVATKIDLRGPGSRELVALMPANASEQQIDAFADKLADRIVDEVIAYQKAHGIEPIKE